MGGLDHYKLMETRQYLRFHLFRLRRRRVAIPVGTVKIDDKDLAAQVVVVAVGI